MVEAVVVMKDSYTAKLNNSADWPTFYVASSSLHGPIE